MLDDNFQHVVALIDQPPVVAVSADQGASSPQATSPVAMAALAPSLPVAASNVTTSMSSPEKRIQLLQQLIDLQKSGALTYDEFANEKAKILSN